MSVKMPIEQFVNELKLAYNRKDGYIMGSKGQDPKKWSVNSWWFTQYSGSQKTKALYWREHANHVWDCNGMAEGIYENFSGVNINTKARYNYAEWCDPKGSGTIPVDKRVAGAAVFWSDSSASGIHHVGYLIEPVKAGCPEGDWYLIEARGVMYGVVKTKLNGRKPNYWGWMTKYFDYTNASVPEEPSLQEHDEFEILKKGSEGAAVTELQKNLLLLGYSLPKYGADGDFGSETKTALKEFQKDHNLEVDGEYGEKSDAAMKEALKAFDVKTSVTVTGGTVNVRTAPNTTGKILGTVKAGTVLEYQGLDSNGWHLIIYNKQNAWISGKYTELK